MAHDPVLGESLLAGVSRPASPEVGFKLGHRTRVRVPGAYAAVRAEFFYRGFERNAEAFGIITFRVTTRVSFLCQR